MAKMVVVFETKDHREDSPDYNYYGEYPQGSTVDLVRIYELQGENRFFKMTGVADSYGHKEWHSDDMVEVKPTPKTVTVYDYAEV